LRYPEGRPLVGSVSSARLDDAEVGEHMRAAAAERQRFPPRLDTVELDQPHLVTEAIQQPSQGNRRTLQV
jgi:hypothetical protein